MLSVSVFLTGHLSLLPSPLMLPLYVRVLSGAPCPSTQTSCHLCLTFCKSGWMALELGGGGPWKISKLAWTPLLCKSISIGIPLSRSLSRPKAAALPFKVMNLILPCSIPSVSWTPPFCSHCTQGCSQRLFHAPDQFFLGYKYKGQQSASHHRLLDHLCWKGTINALQKCVSVQAFQRHTVGLISQEVWELPSFLFYHVKWPIILETRTLLYIVLLSC